MVLYKLLKSNSSWGQVTVDLGSTYLIGKAVGTHNCVACGDVHLEYSLACVGYTRLTSAGVSTWQANKVSEAVRARCINYPVPGCAYCNFPAPALSVYELLYCVTLSSSLDKSIVPPNSQFAVSGNTKDQYNNPMNGQVVKINIYKSDGSLWLAETATADAAGNFAKTISTVAWNVDNYRVDVISDDVIQTFSIKVIYTSTVTFNAICTDTGLPCPASVYLDGSPKGTTPLTLTDVPVGTYNYKVTKSGYADAVGTINVQQGVTTNVAVNLNPAIGNVYFSSEPDGAAIVLDGVVQAKVTPATLSGVATGTHNYILRKANFKDYPSPAGGTVAVLLGQTTNVSATLIPVEGCVYFTSTPPGAKIIIDDADTGKVTPSLVCGLALGLHTYKLLLAGYKSITGTMDMTSGQGVSISSTLVVAKGNISFSSVPGGAEVFLGGEDQGVKTPVTITDVPAGSHSYTLKLVNYNDFTGTVLVEENQTALVSASLTPAEGCIYFNTVPAGARIFIDNVEQAGISTPALVCGVSIGTHKYRLIHPDYVAREGSVTLVVGEGAVVSENLTHETGSISFKSTPDGAEIFIDNVGQGIATPATITEITGTHDYTLRKAGYNDYTGVITVSAGQIAEVKATLVPAEGCIDFSTSPKGARIFIDGRDTGKKTPALICGLRLGTHTYMLVLEGYQEITGTAALGAGKGATITGTLAPKGIGAGTVLGLGLLGAGILGAVIYTSREKKPPTAREYLKYPPGSP